MSRSELAGQRLLVVSAHPDDAEFTSGGSLARWTSEGWQVTLVVCTDGSKGSQDVHDDGQSLAATRRIEQENAARLLGIEEVVWLGHPDGELAQTAALREALAYLIRTHRPTRLLTWDSWRPYQLHPDHRAAGLATIDAILAAGNPHFYPEQLRPPHNTRPHRVEEVYLYGVDQPDVWVDITATFERKMAAIECHRSQVVSLRDMALKMSHCNRERAAGHSCTYAEAFKVLHPFCDT